MFVRNSIESINMLRFILCAFFLLSINADPKTLFMPTPQNINFCDIINNVTEKLRPYQLVLIIENLLEYTLIQAIFVRKCVLWDYPLLSMDVNHLKILEKLMNFTTFGSSRSTSLFVMLRTTVDYNEVADDDYSQFCKVINNYDKIWPRTVRPKWLMIYLNVQLNMNKMYEALTLHAWKKKFLDFTILEWQSSDTQIVYHYNPFTNAFIKENYSNPENLFPDKLHNMHGYPLKTVLLNEPPTLFLEYNESGYVIDVNSSDYWNLKVTSEILNFTMNILPTFLNDAQGSAFSKVNSALRKGEIDFSGNQLYLWNNEIPERSYVLRADDFCALVPVLPDEEIIVRKSFYVIILFTSAYIIIMKFTVKLLGFENKYWSGLTMIQMVFGATILKQPKLVKERIVFGCVILLSLLYLSNYYAEVTDIKLSDDKVSLETFRDLDGSGLIPLVSSHIFNRTFEYFGSKYTTVKNLERKSARWENQWTCADQLLKDKVNNFCIVSATVGMYMVEKYTRLNDGKPRIQISKRCFAYNFKGYAFSPATPYVEKFDILFQRIFETGFQMYWKWLTRPRQKILMDNEKNTKSNIVYQIVFILSLGYLIALIILLLEIVIHRI